MMIFGNVFRAIIFTLCIGAVILGGGVIWTLSRYIQEINTAEQSDPLWIASQLEIELLRFHSELAEYAISRKSVTEITLRFDILWSRAQVMQTGKMAALIDGFDIDRTILDSFQVSLGAVDPIVQSLPSLPLSPEDRMLVADEILAELSQYELQLKKLSLSLAQAKSLFMSEFRNNLLSLSRALAYLGVIILVLASIVFTLLFVDIRSSKRKELQLQKLVVEVEAAAKMKDNFMSVVSHELRTPLTSILGGISLLRLKHSEKFDNGAHKMVDIAYRNAKRLLSLVNDILDAQSLSEGKVKLSIEQVDINGLIADAIEECEGYADQLGVKLSKVTLENGLTVSADKSRISQVLNNFLSNAAKFSASGDIVEVKACQEGPSVRIEVVDRGRGIPQAEQANLFSRFHQVNPGTTGAIKSTGLGLSIAKQLIEMHGGQVGFTSVEGKGSTFWFSLPLVSVANTE
jgi:signal transduction histidine kinase